MVDPKPVKVNSKKELDQEFAKIAKLFSEKESEDNWERRDKALNHVRGLLRGGAHEDYKDAFMSGILQILEGIVETIHSLRTSLVLTVMALITDLTQQLTTTLDPKAELLLQNLIKACAATKKLISQSAAATTHELIRNTSYHVRNLNAIHLAVVDKNGQLRAFAAGFIKTVLEAHGHNRYDAIVRSGGVEIIDKSIRRGVADANPSTREVSREAFQLYWELWQDRAQAILNSVDASNKKQLIRQLGKLYTASTQGITVSSKTPLRPASRAGTGAAGGSGAKTRAASSLGKHVLTVTTSEDAPIPTSPGAAKPHSPMSKGGARSGRPSTPSASIVSPPLSPRRPASRMSATSSNESRSRSPSGPRRTPSSGSRGSIMSPQPPLSPTSLSSSAARRLSVSPPPARQVSTTRSSSPSNKKRPMSPTVGRRSQSVASHRPGVQATRRPGSSLGHRRLPLIDQLKHTDWRVRVEGLVEMTHMMQAEGSSYEALVEAKALPVAQTLTPVLLSLFTDANADVVKAALVPEHMDSITQVVPLEQIISRVISIETSSDVASSCGPGKLTPLRRLKQSLGDYYAAPALCRCLISGAASGPGGVKKAAGTPAMSAAGRRKIIAGVVAWMKEMSDRVIDENNGEIGYEAKCYFADMSNFKLYLTRLFPLLTTTSATSKIYQNLVDLINNLRQVNHVLFEQVLYSFDAAVVADVEAVTGIDVARMEEEEEEGYYDDHPEIGMPVYAAGNGHVEVGEEDGVYGDEDEEADYIETYDAQHYNGAMDNDMAHVDSSIASLSINGENGNSQDMTAPLTPPKGSSTTNGHATNGSTSASKPKSPPTPLRISTDVDKKPMSLFSRHGLSATSPLSAGVSDKIDTLHRGLSQLHDGTADSLIFRKLIRLAKETSPDIDPTLTESVWGANGEGFSALVTESITFLENEKDVAKKEYCILLVKQLLHCESALLGVDANALLRQLMICRTNDSHSVCSAAEDALDAFVSLTNHQVCLDALIHLLEGCVAHIASEARANGEGGEEEENESTNNDGEASSSDQHNNSTNDTTSTINFGTLFGVKSNPLATGFMLFSKLLRRSECTILSSEAVAKIVGLATEGLNNHTPEVRKSAVDLLVALHGIQGDQLDVYLTHLSVPQRKLVAVYINRNQIVR